MDVREFEPSEKDEIARLSESFNRMHKSLVHAIQMLEV